jgi:hypothetical protein
VPGFPGDLINPAELSKTFYDYAILLTHTSRLPESLAVLRRGVDIGVFDYAAQAELQMEVMNKGGRYPIAYAAASVGSVQGHDAATIDEKEQARWRKQALDCLRADLAYWTKVLNRNQASDVAEVQRRLKEWQRQPNRAGVRGDGIPKLPASEQEAWRKLWAQLEEALAKARDQGMNSKPGATAAPKEKEKPHAHARSR